MWARIKTILVEDFRKAHKFLSVQLAALLVALDQAAPMLPQLQQYLPAHWVSYVALAIMVGRLIKQTKAPQ